MAVKMRAIENKTDYYSALDGLRTIAAMGLVCLHVKANTQYAIKGFVFETIVPFLTNFVYLFMMISAFGMCVGYYKKITMGIISPVEFYEKRYKKVLPCFALLVILDVILSPSREALIEAFANLTLFFGLLPNANISVIGVGWFLGVVFVFYMLFPFFCFLIKTKKEPGSHWV